MANQLISVMPQELQTFSTDALVIVYKEDTELT